MSQQSRRRKRINCDPKVKHETAEYAFRHVWGSKYGSSGPMLAVYECPHCLMFHVGHRKPHLPPPSGPVLKFLVSAATVEDRERSRDKVCA